VAWHRPAPAEVWTAIGIYLKAAYPGEPPSAIKQRLETLRSVPADDFFESGVIEHEALPCPPRYALRLGNRFYPHMKLVIERSPDGRSYLFRADTHDRHCMPDPKSREYRMFCELMETNQQIAGRIEAAWAQAGLPTFKSFLRQDLSRRAAVG
jgi:hypothetical protein